MATGSQLNLVNRALLGIGSQSQVSSFNEGSPQANAAATLYTPTFEEIARCAPWNCLRQQASLTLLAAAQGTPENPDGITLPLPPIPWLYQYALPSDCLQMRSIISSMQVSTPGVPLFPVATGAGMFPLNNRSIPFAVAYATDSGGNPLSVILTSQSQAIGIYTVNQPNPQFWDSLLQGAFVAALSAKFVPALSLHMPLMQVQIKLAESLIEQARVRDGNEGTTSMDHLPDFIRARSGAGGSRFAEDALDIYPNMAWGGH